MASNIMMTEAEHALRTRVYELAKQIRDYDLDETDRTRLAKEIVKLSGVCNNCHGTGQDGDSPDAAGVGGGVYACGKCNGSGFVCDELPILLPWRNFILQWWSIVGMNHYHVRGDKRIFVAMANHQGQCIKAEGPDDDEVWRSLSKQAQDIPTGLEPSSSFVCDELQRLRDAEKAAKAMAEQIKATMSPSPKPDPASRKPVETEPAPKPAWTGVQTGRVTSTTKLLSPDENASFWERLQASANESANVQAVPEPRHAPSPDAPAPTEGKSSDDSNLPTMKGLRDAVQQRSVRTSKIWHLFHAVWGKAKEGEYDKEKFVELQTLMQSELGPRHE